MNKQQALFLIIFYSIPFLFYLIAIPTIIGFDSYYFLHAFQITPENFWIIKILLWFLGLVFLFGITQLASLFTKNDWYAGLFAISLTPLLFIEFAKFENDQFAFALLPWLVFFGLKKGINNKIYCFGLLSIAVLIWNGSIFYLIALGLTHIIFFIPAIICLIWFGSLMLGNILPINTIIESKAGIAIVYLFLLLPGVFGIGKNKQLCILTMFFLVLGLINLKFAIHAVPFLAIGMVLLGERIIRARPQNAKTLKTIAILLPVYLTLMYGIVLLTYPPTKADLSMVDAFIEYDSNKSDWSYCHWIRYYSQGQVSPAYCFGGKWNYDYNTGVILTSQDLNCPILFDNNNTGKIFKC